MAIDFIGIGTQKGGTTTLRAYLSQHELICIPAKELHFFDNEKQDWINPDFASYHENFNFSSVARINAPRLSRQNHEADSKSRIGRICGEITPIYMYWEPCLERIYNYNPTIRLIILLRNPYARAYSHWAMEKARGWEDLPFSDALRQEEARLSLESHKNQHRVYSYLKRSLYSVQLKRCLKLFPRPQILILRSEDFFRSPQKSMHIITSFLEISPIAKLTPIHKRKGVYSEPISSKDWRFMASKLEEDISSVETLLSWNCSDWRHQSA